MNDLYLTAYHSVANCDKNSPTFVHNSPEQYFPFFIFFFYLQLTELTSLIMVCKEKL